ncbi:hypothetical protein [Limnohabitans planktonicus]|uniref:Uncharacterized protein n=1 Tax=Limnohabitans planktonicus II-D5 TaxID=1293045 RepID=A0A2T7U8L7_9BURK|nr:hypothetical protein [Limnohabitans planktonicus]PVE40989.1 hypothetical protein H663_019530 [Limnohabitans planktonicus II-D5]
MSNQLRHRRRRTHRSNALKRVAPTRFTHTRATRRSLALAVQRLIDASTRFKLVPIRRSRWSLTLALQGWPDAVRVQVSAHSLALVVTHDGRWWDALLWPDCQPQKCRGGWRCALCTQMAPYSHVFRHLSDLLFAELAQPLLNYLNRLPEQAQLRLSAFQGGGTTWARVVADAGTAPAGACAVVSWPIGGTA